MHTHSALNPTTPRKPVGLRADHLFERATADRSAGALPSQAAYGHAALANALAEGLMADEVAQILGGRRIVDAFPVRRGESPAEYAARTVAEMFVAYLQ